MKIVIAPDSFKGSLTAVAAAEAIERGVKRASPQAETVLMPMADGGEGTMDSLVAATGGRKVRETVTGPLGDPVQAEYGWLGDGQTCVIEMAGASGLCCVPESKLNPLRATTYGTGELIRKALDAGCRSFILAVGGSATNDGGIGMLQALGLRLTDERGVEVGFGGEEAGKIARIDDSGWDPRIESSRFILASDVLNPLVGENGASYVFGPQKGADSERVRLLDRNLQHWADTVAATGRLALHDLPGAGAGGGIGGAYLAFFPCIRRRGIDVVIEYTGFRQALRGSSAVITGEGRIDSQTASGKTPMGVAEEAKNLGIPVFVLAGSVGRGVESLYTYGVTSIHSIADRPMSLQEALDRAAELLEEKACQLMRTIVAFK